MIRLDALVLRRPAAGPVRLALRWPGLGSAAVRGPFSGWRPLALTPGADGAFTGLLVLPAGGYDHAFEIDGIWRPDPLDPAPSVGLRGWTSRLNVGSATPPIPVILPTRLSDNLDLHLHVRSSVPWLRALSGSARPGQTLTLVLVPEQAPDGAAIGEITFHDTPDGPPLAVIPVHLAATEPTAPDGIGWARLVGLEPQSDGQVSVTLGLVGAVPVSGVVLDRTAGRLVSFDLTTETPTATLVVRPHSSGRQPLLIDTDSAALNLKSLVIPLTVLRAPLRRRSSTPEPELL